ncbi:MAG: cation:proton antiporter [Thermoplasmata archaeon]
MTDVDSAFLLSMATVIAIAAVTVVLFHRLRQPLILGYLVAGMVAGQFLKSIEITEPPGIGLTITDFIRLLASLGIILLTFYIGLEFSFRQLRKIGLGIIAAATIEIMLMIGIGYQLGEALGWNSLESTLLGSMLCIASTMMIARALRESGGLMNDRARLVIGLLVVEDFAAVLILAAVSGLVSTGGVSTEQISGLGFGMALFVASSIIIGLVVVPPLVDYVGRQRSSELLVLTALGLCFSMAFFARWIGLSEAIGSFVMGVIMSESKYIGDVIRRIEPVRDLFGAMFFITVGMLVDLSLLKDMGFVMTVLLITGVFVAAKMFACTTSTFITGFGARNAVGAGMSMIAIGEFSLMIAAVAVGAPGIRETIYPTIVVVTTLTAMIVPYSVRYTDKAVRGLERSVPRSLFLLASYMNLIFKNLRRRSRSSVRMSNEMRTSISRMFLYIVVMVTAVIFAINAMPRAEDIARIFGGHAELLRLIILEAALVTVALSLVGIWSRTVRLTEIGTSEAMLATRSAEKVGYDATSRALKWSLLAFYIFVGFFVASPLIRMVVQENIYFAMLTLLAIAVAIAVLWRSVQTVDRKLSEIFEQRGVSGFSESSRDLAEIEDIIAAMEEGRS